MSEFFPGSKARIPSTTTLNTGVSAPSASNLDTWDSRPKTFNIQGVPSEFFEVGALASALNRKVVTLRLWERNGTIPKSMYRSPQNNRLYTRAQIEGMREIARQEGLLETRTKSFAASNFTPRVIQLYKDLNENHPK
jgi:hypothetical protein